MKRSELEHLLRAAGAITQETSIIVIGSQSILGAHPFAPAELLESREADMFPRSNPEKGEILDAIGEESIFDKTFGYHAQWVDESTATLPKGWKGRLVKISNEQTGGVTGYCLDPVDLVVSKLAAGRPKDYAFVGAFLEHGMGSVPAIMDRVDMLTDTGDRIRQSKENILAWLDGWQKKQERAKKMSERNVVAPTEKSAAGPNR